MRLLQFLADCNLIEGNQDLSYVLEYLFRGIMISTPILVLILITVDVVRAVTSGKEDDMKKAQKNAITRIIIGVIIFFVPLIVRILLVASGKADQTCMWKM